MGAYLGPVDPMRDGRAKYEARQQSKHEARNRPLYDKIANLEKQLNSKPKQAAPAPAKPAKPAVPKEQSQKIEPVKHSPEAQQAKSRVQEYQKKDYSSIFKQNETDYTAKFQPSASGSSGPQKDPQNFADKYKFEVNTSANKQMDTTSDHPMSAAEILRKDKENYG
jgi:hypothetical protein